MKGKESGQALIMVLVILALGTLLVFPTLVQAYTSQRYHQLVERNTSNAYTADSGIEYGYWEVYNNAQDIQPGAPWQQSFAANDATVNVTAEYVAGMAAYKITSTATSAGNRSTTIVAYVIIDIGLFGNAFACDGNLNITQSDLGSDEEGGCDIFANGNISLVQSSVDGDVTAAGTVSRVQSTVTGEITEHAQVLDFPDIDPQPHIDAALVGGTSGSITWTNAGNKTLGPKYINGNLKVTKTNVELQGTVYVTGYVDITQSGFSGFGDIVAAGYVKWNQSSYNNDEDTLPLIFSLNSYITISQDKSTPGFESVLYAPNGTINLSQVDVYGAVAAHTISVTQAEIFYPASVKGRPDLPGAGMETITYGYQ